MSQDSVKKVGNASHISFQPVKVDTGKKGLPNANQTQRNTTDLGTSGCGFSSMYLGNAMQVAADNTRVYVDPQALGQVKPVKIVVVDDFKTKIIDIDGDQIADLSHGEVVEKYVLNNNPVARIEKMQINADKDGTFDIQDYTNQMNTLADRIEAGEKFDAVNVSLADEIDLTASKDINASNIRENEAAAREDMVLNTTQDSSPRRKNVKAYIEATERVTALGTEVYIAGGNDFVNGYNLFGLADGTTQVGTISAVGDTILAKNSDIERYERGEYFVDPIFKYDDKGNESIAGYDITEDGNVDVFPEQLSSKGKRENYSSIVGSSFSTPTAVGKDTNPINKFFGID